MEGGAIRSSYPRYNRESADVKIRRKIGALEQCSNEGETEHEDFEDSLGERSAAIKRKIRALRPVPIF